MTIFCVKHTTVYRYARPVEFGEHRLMFRPRDSYDQKLLGAVLTVDPEPSHVRWIHDVFGNCVALVRIAGRSAELRFETRIRLDHSTLPGPDVEIDRAALTFPFAYDPDEATDLACNIRRHYPDPENEIGRWARRFIGGGPRTDTGTLLMTMCFAIHESFSYT